MIAQNLLKDVTKALLRDAKALRDAGRYDGAVYLAGYAIEVAFKSRICKTLKWSGFPETGREFEAYNSFKTHDVVVSAPWIEKDKKEALTFIAKPIQSKLADSELSNISRIVIVDKSNPALDAVHKAANVAHGAIEIRDSVFFGLPIKHAFLITSQRLDKKAA